MKSDNKVPISQQYPEYKHFFTNPDSLNEITLIPIGKILASRIWKNYTFEKKLDFLKKLNDWENKNLLTLSEDESGNIRPKGNKFYLGKMLEIAKHEKDEENTNKVIQGVYKKIDTQITKLKTRTQKLNYISKGLLELQHYSQYDKDLLYDAYGREILLKDAYYTIEDYLKKKWTYWENFIEEEETKTIHTNDLKWDGDKYELAELIYSLYKSERIKKDNKPIFLKDLTSIFEIIFNTQFKSLSDTLNKGLNATKRSENEEYFVKELVKYIDDKVNELRNKS